MGIIIYPWQERHRIDAPPRLAGSSNDLEELTDLPPRESTDGQAVDLLALRPASAEQGD